MDAIPHKSYQFERFTLDVLRRVLRGEDGDIELRPKSFDVLCCLVDHAGQLVTKDELIKTVWPDVVVTDDSLSRCISDVRQALGDGAQRIVKTIPRRGYVFAAPVSRSGVEGTSAVRTGGEKITAPRDSLPTSVWDSVIMARLASTPRWLTVAAAAFSVGLIALAAWFIAARQPQTKATVDRPAIAVMPFTNSGGAFDQDYFSDGLTQDITTRLAKFEDLVVIARDSAFTYKNKAVEPRQIGRELGVRYLLRGSMRRDAERFRISAQLIDAATGVERWAETYDRELAGLFATQDELAQKIATALAVRITKSELERALRKPPGTLAAYDYYLQGMAVLATVDASSSYGQRLLEARQFLQQAVAADPRYAPAITALADTYHRAWLVPTEYPATAREFQQVATSDRALTLAQEAVAIDPLLAEAHAQLGWSLHWRYRRAEAIAEFRRALELNPNMSDGRFTLLLVHNGQAAEGIDFMKRVTRLDPFHRPIYFSYLANAYYLVGDYERSLQTSQIAVGRMPDIMQARAWHAAAAAQLGRDQEARLAGGEVQRLRPDFTISKFLQTIRFSRPEDADRLRSGLRKAGLPE